MQTIVVLLSTEYADELIAQIPHAKFFPERATAYAGVLEKDTKLIAVVPRELHSESIRYLEEDILLGSVDLSSGGNFEILAQPLESNISIAAAVLKKPSALIKALSESERGHGRHILNFSASKTDIELAKLIGATLDEECLDICVQNGSKFGSKQIFDSMSIPQPRWNGQLYFDIDGVVSAVSDLVMSYGTACVKMNDPSMGGGIGNFYFSGGLSDAPMTASNLGSFLDKSLRPFSEFLGMIKSLGCIVEEYLPSIDGFPSVLCRIEDKEVSVVSVQEQIIENSHFSGFRMYPNAVAHNEVARYGTLVGQALVAKGFRGSFGVDFARLPGGKLLALEVNLRKTGVSHVISFIDQSLSARKRCRDKSTYCVYRRGLFVNSHTDVDFRGVLSGFRRLNTEFDKQLDCSVFLLNFSAIEVNGFVEFCVIGSSVASVEKAENTVIQFLSSLT